MVIPYITIVAIERNINQLIDNLESFRGVQLIASDD